jgi:hypothetical protein
MNQDASEPAETGHMTIESADHPEEAIRVGSPFATDPSPAVIEPKRVETFYDVGPIRYTAMGAVAASVMVLGFGAAAATWFPTGGVLIAALGCGLSLFGLTSVYRFTSIGLLLAHLGLFLFCYSRSLA